MLLLARITCPTGSGLSLFDLRKLRAAYWVSNADTRHHELDHCVKLHPCSGSQITSPHFCRIVYPLDASCFRTALRYRFRFKSGFLSVCGRAIFKSPCFRRLISCVLISASVPWKPSWRVWREFLIKCRITKPHIQAIGLPEHLNACFPANRSSSHR